MLLWAFLFFFSSQGLTWGETAPESDLAFLLAEGTGCMTRAMRRAIPIGRSSFIKKFWKSIRRTKLALWKLSQSFRWQGDIASSSEEKLGRYKEGERWAKRAIEVNPQSIGGHLMLGIAYGRIGETQGS